MKYAIRFNYAPDWIVYAGMHKGAFGWAPQLETALLYDDKEVAERVLKNCYGKASAEYGEVIEVPA